MPMLRRLTPTARIARCAPGKRCGGTPTPTLRTRITGTPTGRSRAASAIRLATASWKSLASRASECAPRATSWSLRTDDPAFSLGSAQRNAIVRLHRTPCRMVGTDRRVEQVRRPFREERALQFLVAHQPHAERLAGLERLHDAPPRGTPCGRVIGARVALVGLANTELLAHEEPRIGLQCDAAAIARQQGGNVHARCEQARRTFVEHERDRRIDELHRAR